MAKLHFYYSAMNAGKTTVLLQSNYNYRERGMDTIVFTPQIDTRYGRGKITSRIGLQTDAVIVDNEIDLYEYTKDTLDKNPNLACVLIDEVQFLKKHHVEQMTKIVDELDIPVLTYGLRSDFRGEPFEASIYLLIWADQLIEIKTICHCGRKAIMNMMIDEFGNKVSDGAQIQIGGNNKYIATCRAHYDKGISGMNTTEKYRSLSKDTVKE